MFSLRPVSAFILAVSTASVLAGTFVSPAAFSTISSSAEFDFTWVSTRYFKESSQSISVLLAPNANFPLEGIVLVKDLIATAPGVGEAGPTYSASLTPEFVASSSHTGDFVLVVIEDYFAYGGNPAMSVEYQTITL
ncbi:hypothetical protein BDP27DRAFT_1314879, partial [Rhodocollybia butyracea]